MCRCVVLLIVFAVVLHGSFSQDPPLSEGTRTREPGHRSQYRRSCDWDQLEYRLTRLEIQVGEKSDGLRGEVRENNRLVQAMEYQANGMQSALEGVRSEVARLSEMAPNGRQRADTCAGLDGLDRRVEELVNVMRVAVRLLTTDLEYITRNVSSVQNITSALLQNSNQYVTKQFLANALVDVKHNNLMVHTSTNIPSTSAGNIPKNCNEIKSNGNQNTGIYLIQPSASAKPFMALCDMDTRGGGWTYIHNRFEGSQDFYLDMHDYKHGFGNLAGEFWLGLDHVHELTGSDVNELLVELEDFDGEKRFAQYSAFSVGSELEGYALKVIGGYVGDAGDSLIYHAGSRFSTKDLDQDGWVEGNCAASHTGAWWYRGCDTSNLNGRYYNGDLPDNLLYQGMYWGEFKGAQYSLKEARMLVRPRDENSAPILGGRSS